MFFYDGSWECYQGFHLGFATVAWIVFVLFIFLPIPGIYLIVRGGARSIIVCDRVLLKIHQPVIDAISEGLRYGVSRFALIVLHV